VRKFFEKKIFSFGGKIYKDFSGGGNFEIFILGAPQE